LPFSRGRYRERPSSLRGRRATGLQKSCSSEPAAVPHALTKPLPTHQLEAEKPMLETKVTRQKWEEGSAYPMQPSDGGRQQATRPGRSLSPEHRRGLLLIGLFKLSKAALSIALGLGALKLMHRDLAAVVLHIAEILRIDPENHFVWLLLNKADLVDPEELRHFSIFTFTYAGLCLVEGTGLMLEKRWAEFFTVTLTGLALPWECFELYKEFTPPRIILLLVNVAVFVYLIWLLRRQFKREREASAS
jgi:uncharacterized membrane protein (DUF2068 family)